MAKTVRAIILGVGAMGYPAIFALIAIREHIRQRGIDLQVAALIDVERTLEDSLRQIAGALDPSPQIRIYSKSDPFAFWRDLSAFRADESEIFLIYDATPAFLHSINMSEAARTPNTIYLGEKPIITLPQDLNLARACGNDIYCDLIETKSVVGLTLLSLLSNKRFRIDNMKFWRLNSSGLRKIYQARARGGVTGGALFDKALHEIGLSVCLTRELFGAEPEVSIKDAVAFSFIPCQDSSNDLVKLLLTGEDHGWNRIAKGEDDEDFDQWTADSAGYSAVEWRGQAGEQIEAEYFFSWIGVSQFDELSVGAGLPSIEAKMNELDLPNPWYSSRQVIADDNELASGSNNGQLFLEEDCRILILDGLLDGKRDTLVCNFLSRPGIHPWIWSKNLRSNIALLEDVAFGSNSLARVLASVILGENESYTLGKDVFIQSHEIALAMRKIFWRDTKSFEEEWEHASDVFGRALNKALYKPTPTKASYFKK